MAGDEHALVERKSQGGRGRNAGYELILKTGCKLAAFAGFSAKISGRSPAIRARVSETDTRLNVLTFHVPYPAPLRT